MKGASNAKPRIDEEQQICQAGIDALTRNQEKISGVLVCTGDGFEIAAQLRRGVSAATLSAMASSQLSLSEAICSETGVATCRNVVMEATGGLVLMMDIPHPQRKLVLTVLCLPDCLLGQVLWSARQCAEELSRQLQLEPE